MALGQQAELDSLRANQSVWCRLFRCKHINIHQLHWPKWDHWICQRRVGEGNCHGWSVTEGQHQGKGEIYKTVVRMVDAVICGLETVALAKRQEAKLEVVDLKMLRLSLRVTKMSRTVNESIRRTAPVEQFGDKVEMIWTCAEEG